MASMRGRPTDVARAELFRVELPRNASLRCVHVSEDNLGVPWHVHPEYQLTLLVAGSGQRVVGDSIASVGPGDLTLLGPNLPHLWNVHLPPGRHRPEAIIVQFDPAAFGAAFWSLPETLRAARLLDSADRGLAFSGRIRRAVEPAITRLPELAGLPQILALVELLDRLAADSGATPICSMAYAPLRRPEHDRLEAVIRRIQELVRDGSELPGRGELAALAGMSERTLSRLFHGQMGRTLPQFTNELRLGRAQRMLMETDLSVTAVAQRCGYQNLSNFNAQFRRRLGCSPQAFRQASRVTLRDHS